MGCYRCSGRRIVGNRDFIYMQHKEMSDFKEQVEIDKQRSELEKNIAIWLPNTISSRGRR